MELTFAREMKAEIVNIRKNEIRFSLSHPLEELICMFSNWLNSSFVFG